MEGLHKAALDSLRHDFGNVVVFRAKLDDDEVTVSYSRFTESQEAVVTIHYVDHRKIVWHGMLVECVMTIKNWDWFLCLHRGLGLTGIHLHGLREEDVAWLPTCLRRETKRGGVCYCRKYGI